MYLRAIPAFRRRFAPYSRRSSCRRVVHGGVAEHIRRAVKGLSKMHTATVDGEAPYLFVVFAAAHFQHHHAAMHEFFLLNVAQQNDRIGECGNMLLASALASDKRFV